MIKILSRKEVRVIGMDVIVIVMRKVRVKEEYKEKKERKHERKDRSEE